MEIAIRKLQSQLTSTIHESNSMEELTDPTLESVSGYEPTNEIMERQMEELRTEVRDLWILVDYVQIERQNREIDDLKHTNDDLVVYSGKIIFLMIQRENEEKCSLIRQESEELKEKLMSAIREKDKVFMDPSVMTDQTLITTQDEKSKLEDLYKKVFGLYAYAMVDVDMQQVVHYSISIQHPGREEHRCIQFQIPS